MPVAAADCPSYAGFSHILHFPWCIAKLAADPLRLIHIAACVTFMIYSLLSRSHAAASSTQVLQLTSIPMIAVQVAACHLGAHISGVLVLISCNSYRNMHWKGDKQHVRHCADAGDQHTRNVGQEDDILVYGTPFPECVERLAEVGEPVAPFCHRLAMLIQRCVAGLAAAQHQMILMCSQGTVLGRGCH